MKRPAGERAVSGRRVLLCFGSFTMLPRVLELMCDVDHRDPPTYVSRGGIKLENALAASGLDVTGRCALDVGASTGGFTDCLLRHGATGVVAVDVGYGQLDWGLRNDPRVSVMERTNARSLTVAMLPYTPDLASVDVSFISLAKVLPAVLGCMAGTYDVMALIKPQFEVGRVLASKGRGVVRDPDDRRAALVSVGARPCSPTTPRGWRGRRATKRRSYGWPSPAAPVGQGLWRRSSRWRGRWSRERDHGVHASSSR